MNPKNKVTIVGAGMVGSTAAYTLIAANVTEEIALIDINQKLVASQVMDLQHSVPFYNYTKVKVGSYDDVRDSKVVVITCGASQKSGETRIELVKKNSSIVRNIIPKIFKANSNVIILMVTNPVDVLTYMAVKMFPKKKNQIIGSGTVLDSARFRFLIGQKLGINPKSIHAYIVGEHGDSEVPLWSTATIGNTPLDQFANLADGERNKIFTQARNAAYAIIEGKQATYYGIGASIAHICKTVLYDHKTVLPVSHLLEGTYGIRNICLSTPVILGGRGILHEVSPQISSKEKKQLQASAATLKKVSHSIN